MDANILWQLLVNSGLYGKIVIRGVNVEFYDKDLGVNKPLDAPNTSEFDTPENRAIVADVIKNYETLAAVAEKEIADEAEREALIQAKIREMAEAALISEGKLTEK